MTLYNPLNKKVDDSIIQRGYGIVDTPSSGSTYIKFEESFKEIKAKSGGKPEFKSIIMAKALIPGGDIFEREMNKSGEEWLRNKHPRFYPIYLKFKEYKTQEINGTPISQCPPISVARVKQLESLSIFTVEQLAELSDAQLDILGMGGRELREKAKTFLEVAQKTDSSMKLVSENEKLKEELNSVRDTIKALEKEVKKNKGK